MSEFPVSGQVRTDTPTYSNGSVEALALDASGALKVTIDSAISVGSVDSQGQYNSPEPTLVSGNKAELQLNNRGHLKVEDLSAETSLASIDGKLTTTNSDLGTINTTLGSPAQDATVSAVTMALGSPAQDTTVSGVTTALGTVNSTLGTPAQDATVSGVTTALGTVNTTLGSPLQEKALSWYSSAAAEETNTAKSGAGKFYHLFISNVNVVPVFAWLLDSTDVSGTPLMVPIPVPGNNGTATIEILFGRSFTTGLTFASSSSGSVYTPTTTADLFVTVGYI